jgi:prepilin-type N-terminal cleavage/methylation domain-containing protein
MKQPSKNMNVFSENGGFTLIEVIIALAVLTIGILAVNAMQTVSVRGNFTANRLTTAATWATDRAEVLFNLEYDDDELLDDGGGAADGLAGLDDADPTSPATTPDGSDLSPDGEYTIYWNVAEDEPMPNLKTINVIITYTGMGAAKTVTLTHRKSKFM